MNYYSVTLYIMFAYVKKGVVTDISTVQLEMKGYQEFEYEGIGNPFFQD